MRKTMTVKVVAAAVLMTLLAAWKTYGDDRVAYAYKVSVFPFYVYQDATSRINNFVVTGWAGDFRRLKIDSRWKESESEDNTCIRLTYIPSYDDRAGYAAVAFQQNPENHWGSLRGGYDLSRAKKLFLFARGERGGEQVELGLRKKGRNEISRTAGMIELTKDWKLYEIDMAGMTFEEVAGGLYVILHAKNKIYSSTVYLDEIYYSAETKPAFTALPRRAAKEF